MCDHEEKESIKHILTEWGFAVQYIEKKNKIKSPDLLCTAFDKKYVIEIKRKGDDPIKKIKSEIHESIGPINTISGIIRKGVKQLTNYKGDCDFKIIWLIADGEDPDSQIEQCYRTIYGIENIFDLDDTSFHYTCYYFYDSSFYRWRNTLDGVIITSWEKGKLCINNYSENSQELHDSYLSSKFENAIINPMQEEKEDQAIIADFDSDRKNLSLVKSYLQDKYKKYKLQHMPIEKHLRKFSSSFNH